MRVVSYRARRPGGSTSAERIMQEPLPISFHNMAPSEALERRVGEQWAKVERHCDDIISARIVLETPHKQAHKSTLGISISSTSTVMFCATPHSTI